ncbi:MAG: PH domain-containing protein [Brevefilum sp.]
MQNEFHPPRRTGIFLQGGSILLLGLAGGYFFFLAGRDPSGLGFLLNMLIALVIFAPLPVLVYRLYALLTAYYFLQRDGLRIRWGLRREDIPLRQIEWVRPAAELGFHLPLPWLRWPGAVLGSRKVSELGEVEFIAADLAHMLLVATPEKIYAISPADTKTFMAQYRKINEMGSLTPLEAQSVYPTVLFGSVWEDRLARWLILGSFGIGLLLLAAVGLAVPRLNTIAWIGTFEPAPAERLLLLPILEGIFWLSNLLFGIFLYRRGGALRIGAYLLWGTGTLTGLLFLLASLLLIF